MREILKILFCFCISTILLSGCESFHYVAPKGDCTVLRQEYGALVKYRSQWDNDILSGPYLEFVGGKLTVQGYEETIYVSKSNSSDVFLRPIKSGCWYYYGENGTLDSIVKFRSIKEFIIRTDTLWEDQIPLAIDSSMIPVYQKKLIYLKK